MSAQDQLSAEQQKQLNVFLVKLRQEPEQVQFKEVMELIEELYQFMPTAFTNGGMQNAVDQNNGSCKILAFGQMHALTPAQTLACFGQYYREDVLNHPNGEDHQNIRQFIQYGWERVRFVGTPLQVKT